MLDFTQKFYGFGALALFGQATSDWLWGDKLSLVVIGFGYSTMYGLIVAYRYALKWWQTHEIVLRR